MIARSIVGRRKRKLSVLVAAATVALSGCGALHPGAAAVVGDTTISHEEVDGVAEALCSANIASAEAQGQQAPSMPTRSARESALQILVETELSKQFGASEGVEASKHEVSQTLAQSDQGIRMLPEDQQDDFRAALKEYAEGQLMLIEVGRESLGQNASEDQAIAEGQRLRQAFVKDLDVEVDPRYGTFENNTVQAGGTALSVAVSEGAVAGEKAQPSDTWVAGLPASQKCS